jgi:hypothetical protein
MVTEGKLRRYQRQKTKELQHRIFALWDKYSEEEITVNQLLNVPSVVCCRYLNKDKVMVQISFV